MTEKDVSFHEDGDVMSATIVRTSSLLCNLVTQQIAESTCD